MTFRYSWAFRSLAVFVAALLWGLVLWAAVYVLDGKLHGILWLVVFPISTILMFIMGSWALYEAFRVVNVTETKIVVKLGRKEITMVTYTALSWAFATAGFLSLATTPGSRIYLKADGARVTFVSKNMSNFEYAARMAANLQLAEQ